MPDLVHQPQDWLNREIRRPTDLVGICRNRDALIRLVGAVLSEQHDEWAEGRRHLGLDALQRARQTKINNDPTNITTDTPDQEVTLPALTA